MIFSSVEYVYVIFCTKLRFMLLFYKSRFLGRVIMSVVQFVANNKKILNIVVVVFSAIALFIAAGCAGGGNTTVRTAKSGIGNFILPQSHYTFPNSNVIPIGTATATARRSGTMYSFPDVQGAMKEAIDKAIRSKGGDLMINVSTNGVLTSTTTISGTSYNISYLLEMEVSGTVATMDIGKQNLH
jgi:hypothetical protein